ncbi:MAG: hypothetical protein ACXWJC_11100 [Croceibacterium sp.]
MAERVTRQAVAEKAIVHSEAALLPPTMVDRSFELPTALYALSVALFLGFMGVTAIGFGNPELTLPMAVIVLSIVAIFGVPAIWVRMAPGSRKASKSWSRFRAEGIATEYGRTNTRDATVQVLILPVLIFLWGIATVIIAALVR